MKGKEYRIMARWSAWDWVIVDPDGHVHGEFTYYSDAKHALTQMNLDWFQMAVAIQNQEDKLDAEEKRFVANVINRLTSIEEIPTPAHRHWLSSINARIKAWKK
jgi:hypothetical protein